MDENIFNNWFNKSYQEQQDLLAKMEAYKYEGKTLQEIFEGQDSLNFYNSSTHPCIVAPDGQNLIDLQTKKAIPVNSLTKQARKRMGLQQTPVVKEKELQDLPFIPVQDLFKQYQKERLKEAKKSEQDYIKEIFSTTELFDLTNIPATKEQYILEHISDTEAIVESYPTITLPFANCFLKIYEGQQRGTLFVREYSPTLLSGSNQLDINNAHFNFPFLFDLETNKLEITVDLQDKLLEVSNGMMDYSNIKNIILVTLYNINRLNTHKVLVDHLTKPEYYSFTNKPTVKINNRPIYYVLDKNTYNRRRYNIKAVTKLTPSYAFRVRGHWRTINSNSLGKDRNGEYKVKGHTWVIDYIKGQGEVVHKLRVIK